LFAIDPKLDHIDAQREQVVAIIESVNQPHVAIPGKQPQPAQAFLTGVRNPNASFSIYIYLFLALNHEPVIYVFSQRQFALESYRDAETEALNFVESMGFMIAQNELLGRIPIFEPIPTDEVAIEAEADVSERGQKLARLLGAF
jgi:hypothetical protein